MRSLFALLAAVIIAGCAPGTRLPHTVQSSWFRVRVRVAPHFRFVGAQQFILRDRVEVEQHLFANAAATSDAERLVWVQYERFLPKASGQYEYEGPLVTLRGIEFVSSVRQYTDPPEPGSDRHRAYELLESRGLRFGAPATRVRLVHVPADDRRSEVMIIYAERTSRQESETAALLARAIASISVESLTEH